DVRKLLCRQRLAVGEVEPQLVRAHGRARLADVRAKAPAQSRVQQVGGGVVAGRRVAQGPIDDEVCALPLLQLASLQRERDRLVVPQAVYVLDPRGARLGLDPSTVRDLSTAL